MENPIWQTDVFSKRNFHDTVSLSFWDPNWQQARRSPKQSHHLRRHRRPDQTVLVRPKSESDIKCHGWLDFMVKALWNYQPPWNNCGWKTIVHFGMASPQGPCLLQRRHCHIWWFVLPTTSPGNATRSASREISRIGNNHDQPTIHFVWQPLADAQNVWCKGKTPTNVQNKCFKFLIDENWMH